MKKKSFFPLNMSFYSRKTASISNILVTFLIQFYFSGSCNTKIDQCVANPCVEGTCVPHGSFYRSCDCYQGYTGDDCEINIGI